MSTPPSSSLASGDRGDRVDVRAGVPPAEIGSITSLFQLAFAASAVDTALGEDADPRGFVDLVQHPDTTCFRVCNDAGDPVGFAAVVADLGRVSWVHAEFYRSRYPVAHYEGRLFYLPYVFVHPDWQTRGVVAVLFEAVAEWLNERRAVVGFDVSRRNVEAGLVELFRRTLGRKSPAAEVGVVDTHTFFVGSLGGAPH